MYLYQSAYILFGQLARGSAGIVHLTRAQKETLAPDATSGTIVIGAGNANQHDIQFLAATATPNTDHAHEANTFP
ncbi:hypothetical protein KSZ_62370 [Dictyobacter formicarum]|uniref:Uncharacterized protein n=1 Tax=Dictyobacter formicarum TaxID=2778368 RepID=A0ABQ3VSY1_9CHLR|nr:hypothetical protein KSZ_62370 [Dictyobacter formicarum]